MTATDVETKALTAVASASSGLTDPQQWLIDAVSGPVSATGAHVTTRSALGLPAVYSSVNQIAGHIGILPIELHRPVRGGSEVVENHPVAARLRERPNQYQTAMVFKQTMHTHTLLNGNGRAWINRNGLGQATELIIMPPSQSSTLMIQGEKYHRLYLHPDYVPPETQPVTYEPRSQNYVQYVIHDNDCLHIPSLSLNGLWGESLVSLAKDVFGLDMSGQQATAYNFSNNGRPGLMLEAPVGAFRTDKEAKEFMDNFNEEHAGLDKSGRTGLIKEGMKAHVLPLSAADAEFLAQRGFSREDIFLLFGTSLLHEAKGVYKDLSERNAAYIQNCLAKWFEVWEQECNRKLLSAREKQAGLFFKFNAFELYRNNLNAIADYTSSLRSQALVSTNEARRMHGLNPIAGGDDDYVNPNTATQPASEEQDEPEAAEASEESGENEQAKRRVFEPLIKYEMRRVKEASKRPGNFLSWLGKFYDTYENQLASACTDLRIDAALGEAYCAKSKQCLLEVAGAVTPDGLSAAVADLIDDWPDRAREFTNDV